MKKKYTRIAALFLLVFGVFLMFIPQNVYALPDFQVPTGSIPTVTGTPKGPTATVKSDMGEPFLNVRSGPGALYEKIGVLLPGQSVPAVGVSPKGEYYLIEYPGVPGGTGWVSSQYIEITGGQPPVVQPPATVTPAVTATFDPTLAAQFIVTIEPTRMPTFTQPAPLEVPTYAETSPNQIASGVPMGLVIAIILVAGILVGAFSMLQSR
ncbi:protein containg bacterial SH3 domain [Longilinea arvoryzae]|uniref:Protein containg bacterial SH3 domain n=1 Tax=Longilinea arvoryzae TaxID=360412 RepID=A0A0S7BLW0_9CHLR|nr:SH3 domain-containing protein [Longilinea arvoryzae]GAP14757.1 protein containg bacterial SH3 domain [Longilinea arvoryzae]